jgi:excisionase family DNA binding protein
MELLTVGEAAKRLHCSERTIYALCDAGKLRHARIGVGRGTLRIPADALEGYILESMRGGSTTPTPRRQPVLDPGSFRLRGEASRG